MGSMLNLPTVELVSVIHTAPANGAPSSQDYYNGDLEKVTDLSTITAFLNNTILPILNALPEQATYGLLGTAIFSDIANEDALVYDALTDTPLTIVQSMRLLNGILQTTQITVTSLSQQVGSLQARLSASDQQDLSLALQNITSTLATAISEINSLNLSVGNLQSLVGSIQDTTEETIMIFPAATESVTVIWSVPFADNTYTLSYVIEDSSGFLQITGFSYLPFGAGVNIYVLNSDSVSEHQGIVHASARNSQSS